MSVAPVGCAPACGALLQLHKLQQDAMLLLGTHDALKEENGRLSARVTELESKVHELEALKKSLFRRVLELQVSAPNR